MQELRTAKKSKRRKRRRNYLKGSPLELTSTIDVTFLEMAVYSCVDHLGVSKMLFELF